MKIVSTTPNQNSANISLTDPIKILFDTDIDPSTIDDSSITVTTTKANILTPGTTGMDVDTYKNDSFFNPEFTGLGQGKVTVDKTNTKQLLFTPAFRLKPNTDYVAYIASSIAGVDGSLLTTVMTLKFKTQEEDITSPVTEYVGTVIVGKDVIFPEDELTKGFRILKSSPRQDSFLNVGTKIKISFSQPISSPAATDIEVLISGVLSDNPPTPLDFTLDSSETDLTITLTEPPAQNSFIQVNLIGVKSTLGDLLNSCELNFITGLSPYYTSTKLIRLKAGTILTSVPDTVLAMTILWISQEADVKLKKIKNVTGAADLISKWVLYSALYTILLNNLQNPIVDSIRKTLAEYTISINNGNKVKLYNMLLDEIKQFLAMFSELLNFAYGSGNVRKGSAYPKNTGRTWYFNLSRPGLNTRQFGNQKYTWDEPLFTPFIPGGGNSMGSIIPLPEGFPILDVEL